MEDIQKLVNEVLSWQDYFKFRISVLEFKTRLKEKYIEINFIHRIDIDLIFHYSCDLLHQRNRFLILKKA